VRSFARWISALPVGTSLLDRRNRSHGGFAEREIGPEEGVRQLRRIRAAGSGGETDSDDEAVTVHGTAYGGDIGFETADSTAGRVDQLQIMKTQSNY
jgi:hypothetical protein